jgi:hypothetical protein
MDALQQLLAAVSMKPTLRSLELPNGTVFEFYAKPVTLAQRARAQKLAGNDNASDFALQLLVMMAEDENGNPRFTAEAVPALRNRFPASLAESLMVLLLQEPEQGPDQEEVSPKPSRASSRKTDF